MEAALAMYLDTFATTLGTKEQLAIKEFAEALLVIPKVLATNAAQDATELVAKLCAYHYASQTEADKADLRFCGLDLINGKVRAPRRGARGLLLLLLRICLKYIGRGVARDVTIFRLVFSSAGHTPWCR